MSDQPGYQEVLTPSSVLGIHHVGMSVSNLSEAVSFYQSTASLEKIGQNTIGGWLPRRPEKSAVLKGPNGYLQLMQFVTSETVDKDEVPVLPVQGPGVTHVCFQSPARARLYDKFMNAGATSVSRADPPIDLNGRGCEYAYVRDADGIMFEVEQLDEPGFAGPIWIAHIALVSHDIDRLVDFYQNLFGIEPYRRADKLGGPRWNEVTGLEDVRVRAAWFNTGNMVLELWEYVQPKTLPPGEPLSFDQIGYNKIAFEVSDLPQERARLEQAGVNFLSGATEENGISEIYAHDPDGNLFSLLQTGPATQARVANPKQIDHLPSPSSPLAGLASG